jgi:hypothetical protein
MLDSGSVTRTEGNRYGRATRSHDPLPHFVQFSTYWSVRTSVSLIEDLHWSDDTSLEVLLILARRVVARQFASVAHVEHYGAGACPTYGTCAVRHWPYWAKQPILRLRSRLRQAQAL